jgi:hypothetical protein
VLVELIDPVSTKTAKEGDHFAIRLAEPLVVDGQVVAKAGDTGVGEVIFASPPGLSGRPARLVLAARYVSEGDVKIPLRSFRLGGAGHNNEGAADAVGIASAAFAPLAVVSLAMPGGDVNLPAGARASAKVGADLTLAPLGPAPAAASPNSTTTDTTDNATKGATP